MIKVNARAARMGDSLKACCFLAVLSNFAVVQIRRNLSELLYGSCICRLSLGHTKQAPALCLVSLNDLFVSTQGPCFCLLTLLVLNMHANKQIIETDQTQLQVTILRQCWCCRWSRWTHSQTHAPCPAP